MTGTDKSMSTIKLTCLTNLEVFVTDRLNCPDKRAVDIKGVLQTLLLYKDNKVPTIQLHKRSELPCIVLCGADSCCSMLNTGKVEQHRK